MKIRIRLNEAKNKQQLYDLEKVHFGGDLRDIGETLKFLVDNNKNEYGEIDTYAIDQMLKDAGQTNVAYAGEGAFRITYQHGEDVIKIAKTNTAKIMNEQDTELGRLPIYSSLFPKVYMADEPNYDWIVMEKCETINDEAIFMKFFPNNFYNNMPSFIALRVFQLLLQYESKLISGEPDISDVVGYLEYYANSTLSDVEIKDILKKFNKTFHLLSKMVAEFGISTQEIRPYNTGIAPDGRFVVIDSSIGSAISKGLQSVP